MYMLQHLVSPKTSPYGSTRTLFTKFNKQLQHSQKCHPELVEGPSHTYTFLLFQTKNRKPTTDNSFTLSQSRTYIPSLTSYVLRPMSYVLYHTSHISLLTSHPSRLKKLLKNMKFFACCICLSHLVSALSLTIRVYKHPQASVSIFFFFP